MDRRCFLLTSLAGTLIGPVTGRAQQAGRVWRLGVLVEGHRELVPPAFFEGLRRLGYVEGQNVLIEYRFTMGRQGVLESLAAELIQTKPNVIAVVSAGHAAIVQKLTKTI